MLKLANSLQAIAIQTALFARDIWTKILDTWDNETRKWEQMGMLGKDSD